MTSDPSAAIATRTRSESATKPARRVRARPEPASYWTGWVQCYTRNADGTWRRAGAHSAYGVILPVFIADAFKSATYYLARGYRVTIETIERRCSACQGTGRHPRNTLKSAAKPCKACKGKPVFGTMLDIPVECSENVRIVDVNELPENLR